jgi:glycosyltransferase involved in cell wall biosynthesis
MKNGKVGNEGNEVHEIELSVILPVRNEEENIRKLTDELVPELEKLGLSYEVIGINLPGGDDSYEVMKELGRKYKHFYPVNATYLQTRGLQKGYQYMLGFRHARGRRIIQMDSDYQDDPKDIPKFLEKLDEGYDMVVGWKQDRKDPFFYKLTSRIQNTITRLLSGIDIHDKNCGFKAYERKVTNSLRLFGMNYRDIPLQAKMRGFSVTEVPITNRKRLGGMSNFNFFNRLLGGTLDFLSAVIISVMADKPFRIWGGAGLFFCTLGTIIFAALTWWMLYTAGAAGLNWWVLWWIAVMVMFYMWGAVCFGIGVVMEYSRSQQPFDVDDYFIIDDPKGVTER